MILGIDEVGRGSWAGPLVVGAVVLGGTEIIGLTDSKQLSKRKRESLDKKIRENALCVGLGWVDAKTIDKIGISKALQKATMQAIESIDCIYDEIIIDGNFNYLKGTNKEDISKTIKKADQLIPCVSAASVIAKVARDNFMMKNSGNNDKYGFSTNVGYGTKKHQEALNKYGATNLHRFSFSPLKNQKRSTTSIGNEAESKAAKYLEKIGYKVIDRNWKTKRCEIDIVAQKDETLYFYEVKYRANSNQGDGLSAITSKKLNQMKYAVNIYTNSKNLENIGKMLAVISMTGKPPCVENILEI